MDGEESFDMFRLSSDVLKESSEMEVEDIIKWAENRGVTHYAHWFQPLSGGTAEKHESIFNREDFYQSETDGSSFPTGGLRKTSTSRGYLVWDGTDVFIRTQRTSDGKKLRVLILPSIFCSYEGYALDYKIPLLRSEERLASAASRVLSALGYSEGLSVSSTLGIEQEFFLVDKSLYDQRLDLKFCGRTLYGNPPLRDQSFEDHYCSTIPGRVLLCLEKVEKRLEKMGVEMKTRHAEVAPGQYELTPVYRGSPLAVDQNLLLMETLKQVALEYGLVCLFSEKPFEGLNGSGKHCNWSLQAESLGNLLEIPAESWNGEYERFFLFLAAVIRAVHLYGSLLLASICTPGNVYRLGANEAPPPIMSIYLGEALDRACQAILDGSPIPYLSRREIELEWKEQPKVMGSLEDRNRTSPFAFTGNKFEFRAVGASQNCAGPICTLNTIVAESLDWIADQLKLGQRPLDVVRQILTEHYKGVYNGDNYTSEWREEAQRRGLFCSSLVDSLLAYREDDVFQRMKVMSSKELEALFSVREDNFVKTTLRELRTGNMLISIVVLHLMKFFNELFNSEIPSVRRIQREYVTQLVNCTNNLLDLSRKISDLLPTIEDRESSAFVRRTLLATARDLLNKAESLLPGDVFPFPSYDQLLSL
jgi:glutamine synthetase